MLKGLNTKHFLFSFLILFFESNILFSSPSTTLIHPHPVFTFTTGASISLLGQSQSFAPLDLCSYHYKSNGSNTTMLWGGFIGSEIKHSASWRLVAGLGYYQPNLLSTIGTLTQGADEASSDTYSYNYKTRSQQVLAEGKFYWIAEEKIQPFLMVGIGATFNKTSDYQTSVPPFLEFTPAFSNHAQTNFTYAIGPGIDIGISKSLRIGVAYRFTDLGAANTGTAQIDGILISNTLNQSHLFTNQILAQFTYIPGQGANE